MELLVCPLCKGPLTLDSATRDLVCAADRLAFPVRDGIPVMLESQARPIEDAPAAPVWPPSGDAGQPPAA